MSHLVFVYGSLKRGFHNHRALTDYKPVMMGSALTAESYLLVRGAAFPYLINPAHLSTKTDCDDLLGRVAGELYEVDDDGLARLDRLESHPEFYRREKVVIESAEYVGTRTEAWVYFLVLQPGATLDSTDRAYAAKPDARGVVAWNLSDVLASAATADAEADEEG